jgi:predicted ATPase
LVSVLGIGGTGKTRLVTRFAWAWLGDFPGGAWFCDLSEARSIEGIAHAVAAALDVPLGSHEPIAQLGQVIAARGSCLVVIDNFEQVARHAAGTLGYWLDCARDARFVVTSREVLGLPGEAVLALAPMHG